MVVALDVGGTAIKAARVRADGTLATALEHTPVVRGDSAEAVLYTLAAAVGRLVDPTVEGVAVAFPGPCDYERGVPGRHADGKLAALAGVDVGAELCRRLGRPDLPTRFRNDAEAAIVAEARHGAGRGLMRVLGVTLGSGLGACLVDRGRIVERCGELAPADLYRDAFGTGTADDAFSDRGLRVRLAAAGAAGDDPAEARCPAALRAFAAFGSDLGRFLAPHMAIVRPDGLVVAGGISGAFALFGAQLREQLPFPVRPAELGAAAGVIGAAELFESR